MSATSKPARPDTARGTFPRRKGQIGQQLQYAGKPGRGELPVFRARPDGGQQTSLLKQGAHVGPTWGWGMGLEEPAGLDEPHICPKLVCEDPWWPSLGVSAFLTRLRAPGQGDNNLEATVLG